jgi:hypothetical protein
MAFGDNSVDPLLRDGWHAFCDRLKSAADYVFKDESGSSSGERTNAFRYLTQNLSQAFDIWLENRDTRYPTIHAFCGPTRKLGCDNADCIYLQSWINDHDTYKISGNKGTAKMFNIAVQGPWRETLHEPFGDTPSPPRDETGRTPSRCMRLPAEGAAGRAVPPDWSSRLVSTCLQAKAACYVTASLSSSPSCRNIWRMSASASSAVPSGSSTAPGQSGRLAG